jgi:hypothetical protein
MILELTACGLVAGALYLYHRFGLKPVVSRLESAASRLESSAEQVFSRLESTVKAEVPIIGVREVVLDAELKKAAAHLESYATKSEVTIRREADLLAKEIRSA